MHSKRKASVDGESSPIPRWFSPQSLPKVVRPEVTSVNVHGVMTADHLEVSWPLPTMFGPENYSFSLIDLADDRFSLEAADMSHNLADLFTKQQRVENEWRIAYKKFVGAEQRRNNLTPGVLQKSIDKAETELSQARTTLLELQAKRDSLQDEVYKIWDRCNDVKDSISKETVLEKLRQHLNETVKLKFSDEATFWRAQFQIGCSAIAPRNQRKL